MNGNDHLTVKEQLDWKFEIKEEAYIYRTQHEGKVYVVRRGEEEKKWQAYIEEGGSRRLLGYKPELTVNVLVLEVEYSLGLIE